jgi:hypothetical protein
MSQFADEFREIPTVLSSNTALRQLVIDLIKSEPIKGKALEGGNRVEVFREVLLNLASGTLDLDPAYAETEKRIPRAESPYSASNQVFAKGWGKRLVRSQYSRFYNHAVMKFLIDKDEVECFVPHSTEEKPDSNCSLYLAGKKHKVKDLYDMMIAGYHYDNWSKLPKIPDHPHCTHVVKPLQPQ